MKANAPEAADRPSWRSHVPPGVLFLGLAFWVTYPLWTSPATRIQDLGDPLLNAYILSWDHFAFAHRLFEFFDADIFWPRAGALAFGEHMIAPAILAWPFAPFTDSAVAIHNLSLGQAYFFCALGAYALGWHYFRSVGAATLAGLAYGFAAYRVVQSDHLQLVHGEFLPLMVLAFEKSLRAEDRRWKWALAASALGQWLTSWYWAVFSFGCLGPYFAVRAWQERKSRSDRSVLGSFVPLLIAAAVVLPVAWPYVDLKLKNAFYRPESAAQGNSATPIDFLRPDSRSILYGGLASVGADRSVERALFVGVVPVLGILGAFALWARSRRWRGMKGKKEGGFPLGLWLAITAVLIVFSLGPKATFSAGGGGERVFPLPYALFELLVPFSGQMRVPARWMLPALLGISMLTAFAWLEFLKGNRGKAGMVLRGCVVALLVAESLTRPMTAAAVASAPPPVVAWLAGQPYPGPLLELPLLPREDNTHMLHATWHRQPMMNGTNGFFPPDHPARLERLSKLPAEEGIDELLLLQADPATRLRFIVIDLEPPDHALDPWDRDRVNRFVDLLGSSARVVEFGRHVVIDFAG